MSVVKLAVQLLLTSLLDHTYPEQLQIRAKRLLSDLQQRHPRTVQVVCDEMSQEGKESVREVILSLAMVRPISCSEFMFLTAFQGVSDSAAGPTYRKNDAVVNSMNADPNVRAAAIGELTRQLAIESTSSEERVSSMSILSVLRFMIYL